MQLSVFGLGHLGAVTAACLACQGHEVIAVDVDPGKVDLLRRGVTPVNEPGLGQLIRDAVADGRLRASADIVDAIAGSALTSICGTEPGSGAPLYEAIGAALRDKPKFHSIIVRRGFRRGTVRDLVIPVLERASGKQAGVGFGVGVYPQFLRPGTAIEDYANPPAIILGTTDEETLARLREMDIALQAPELVVDLDEAEAIAHASGRRNGTPLRLPKPPSALPDFSFAASNLCSG